MAQVHEFDEPPPSSVDPRAVMFGCHYNANEEFDDTPPPGEHQAPKKRTDPNALFWFPAALQDGGEIKKPHWMPDEAYDYCQGCSKSFDWITRKHHCRLCGSLFCDACSSNYTLLPMEQFESHDPQRTCRPCFALLKPLQKELQQKQSNDKRYNAIDDESSFARYLNRPLSFTLGGEVRKAAYSLTNLVDGIGTNLADDQTMHKDLFADCNAVLFITVVKVAFLGGVRFGTGLVISRTVLDSGEFTWSAPCAVAMGGITAGLQFGAQVVDMIVPLHDPEAIEHFSSRGGTHALVGSEFSFALGPLGRSAEASFLASESGVHGAMSYSHSRGIYGGITLDGCVCRVRDDVNRKFYGRDVEPRDLFNGTVVAPPIAAAPLYSKMASYEARIDKMDGITRHNRGYRVGQDDAQGLFNTWTTNDV